MRHRFASLDGQTRCEVEYDEPDRYRDLLALDRTGRLAARGAGLSYVAASFGANIKSIGMRRFDRILAFQPSERWIEVEPGISLGKLYNFCSGHGLALPVQPGHPQITIGGCIAANVHGKNQYRDGLFGDHVRELRLLHPAHGTLLLSRQSEPALFELTIGGFGLTGIIVSARLALTSLTAAAMKVEHHPFTDLSEAIARLGELRGSADMAYAWLDFSDFARPGRGYVVAATLASEGSSEQGELRFKPLACGAALPLPLFTRTTLPWVNALYRRRELRRPSPRIVPRSEILYPALGKEFYFSGFGRYGFQEMQVLVPELAMQDYAFAAVALLSKHRLPIALTTLKAFRGRQTLLNYVGDGYSFTMDVPAGGAYASLLADFDALNCEFGAITALAKDSRLSASVMRRQYRDHARFEERLTAFDPERRFASALSTRLEL